MLERAGKKQGNISKYQFWQHNSKPIELWSIEVIKQKINYIHNNPALFESTNEKEINKFLE
jgi:putative transposase